MDFAFNLILIFTKSNLTLINNLKAIVLSKMGRYNEAYLSIDCILKIKLNKFNNFHGRLFPFTLKCFQEATQNCSNKTEMEKFQKLISLSSSRYFEHDIFEYCIRINQK